MRIVLIGQAAFGAAVLEALCARGESLVGVHAPPTRSPDRRDPLEQAARQASVPLFQPASYRPNEVFEIYRGLQPDLTILAFVSHIIPERYFQAATRGAICYHPSLLPKHRGASAINWALIQGDTKTGLTIFWPDGGIDTGPILLQKEVAIGPEDTVGSLYFEHLFPMGVEAILESVQLIRAGEAPRIPQDESEASYEPLCDDRVAAIDWNVAGNRVYDLIRGCDPQPGAYCLWKDTKLRLYDARYAGDAGGGRPGEVLEVDSAGLRLALRGGWIKVGRVRFGREPKQEAAAFARAAGLKPGDRLQMMVGCG